MNFILIWLFPESNKLFVWGKGKEGHLGLGKEELSRSKPTQVFIDEIESKRSKISKIICGPLQTAVITSNLQLFAI